MSLRRCARFFFFNDTATTEIYTLSLHDALPISFHGALHVGDFFRALVNQEYDERNFRMIGGDSIGDGLQHQDRKSTRLNSSHSQISYAVFCLKKKKLKMLLTHSLPILGLPKICS